MIPKEILQKVRRIEIMTSRLVTDIFAGEYHSVFKGQGIEFDEVREYAPGDDIRTIDWNVTARTGKAHVKKFIEERELTVMIIVDVSASSAFASVNQLKSQLAAEIASILAFSATRNNDKVGLMLITDQIEKFIPPRKGRGHVLRVIREVLYAKPKGKGTDLPGAIEFLNNVSRRKTIVFVISDFFMDEAKDPSKERFRRVVAAANKKHDVIAITLNDQRETHLPDCGLVTLQDAESGHFVTVDTSDRHVRESYNKANAQRLDERKKLFRRVGVDVIDLWTHTPYLVSIEKFFKERQARIR